MLRAVQHSLMFFTPFELPSQTAALWLTALLVNALLIGFAQRFPLLTRAGWCHAGIVGTMLWGSLAWRGWLALVAYLVLGSLVTKPGLAKKQELGLAWGMRLHHPFIDTDLLLTNNYFAQMSIRSAQATPQQHW